MPDSDNRAQSLPGHLQDLWQLVVAYARQETLDPLKSLGRYLAFGLAGSAVLGIGLVLLVLGVLRLLQSETGSAFDGHLSWLPYVVVLVACAAVAAAALKFKDRPHREEQR